MLDPTTDAAVAEGVGSRSGGGIGNSDVAAAALKHLRALTKPLLTKPLPYRQQRCGGSGWGCNGGWGCDGGWGGRRNPADQLAGE
jgi:hypothetical protein